MDTVAIIGSCVSRELFNDTRTLEMFRVGIYAFQVNIWDLCSESLELPDDFISSIPVENFTRRMIKYDLNKTVLKEIKDMQPNYLVIDLFNICNDAIRIQKEGKSVFLKTNRTSFIYEQLCNKDLQNVQYKLFRYDEINQTRILKGLERLARWINANIPSTNVVLHYPYFINKYYNLKNEIVTYTVARQTELNKLKNAIYLYTDFLCANLANKTVFNPRGEFLGRYRQADNLLHSAVPVHYTSADSIKLVSQFLQTIHHNSSISEFDALSLECMTLSNLVCRLNKSLKYVDSDFTTSLNNYVSKYLDTNEQIVVISTKNQASEYIHKFYMKTKLGIQLNVNHSESYVCIIDRLNKYVVEKTDKNDACLCYSISGLEIKCDSNFTQNKSSIIINGVEYSKNCRGLNFVIIDRKQQKVVKSFNVDTYDDALLLLR